MGVKRNLASEIASAIEIFYLGKTLQHYNNAAFILCDDYSEIASKVFLTEDDRHWSGADVDKIKDYREASKKVRQAAQRRETAEQEWLDIYDRGEPREGMKQYPTVLSDVLKVLQNKRTSDVSALQALHNELNQRHKLRNDVFHSHQPLGTTVTHENCIEAFCDLLDYVNLLFPRDWPGIVTTTRNLETYTMLLQLDRKAKSNSKLRNDVDKVFANRPRYESSTASKGVQIVKHANDMHRHLCIDYDHDRGLRVALRALLDRE